MAEPANAFVTFDTEGGSSFAGYDDPLNIDVCWKSTLPPIWVEATRRATSAWNTATPYVHFRSLRPVSSRDPNCDVYIYDTLDFDSSHDGVISRAEGNVRAEGGRAATSTKIGGKTVTHTNKGFVKINTRSPYMQGRGSRDLNSFQSTMVHELGHVLGLKHTQQSNYSRSIMSTSTNSFITPQADDIAGIKFMYSKVTVIPAATSKLVTSARLTPMTQSYWVPSGASSADAPTAGAPTTIDGDTSTADGTNAPAAPAPAPAPAAPAPAKPVPVPVPAKPAVPAPAAPVPTVPTPSVPSTPVPAPTATTPNSKSKGDTSTKADEAPRYFGPARPAENTSLPVIPSLILVVLALLLGIGIILIVRWRRFVAATSRRGGGHRD